MNFMHCEITVKLVNAVCSRFSHGALTPRSLCYLPEFVSVDSSGLRTSFCPVSLSLELSQ